MKSAAELAKDRMEGRGDGPVAWDSKLDKFDQRLALVRNTFARSAEEVLEAHALAVKHVSVYEFYWKHAVWRNRLLSLIHI